MPSINSCTITYPADPIASYEAAIQENPANAISHPADRKKRSVGDHTKFWKTGRTLTIAISRINDESHETIKRAINKWSSHVNLNFEFIDLNDNSELFEGDIRVDVSPVFNHLASSTVGTDALLAAPYETTMQLGTNYTTDHYEALVMHEFGHALGLVHEHQHPDADIPWDREITYQWFLQNYGMPAEMVDAQVFPLDRDPNQTYAPYDRSSIMHYEIPNQCTIGDWHQPNNRQLSAGDIAFARRIYP